jgi:hypothetical protein
MILADQNLGWDNRATIDSQPIRECVGGGETFGGAIFIDLPMLTLVFCSRHDDSHIIFELSPRIRALALPLS